MEYRVTLHNGQFFNIQLQDTNLINNIEKVLNNRETLFVNLGGCIVHKNTVATILPVGEPTESAK